MGKESTTCQEAIVDRRMVERRALSAMIMTAFGGAWAMLSAPSVVHFSRLLAVIFAVVFIAVFVIAIRRYKALRRSVACHDTLASRGQRKHFLVVNAVQWLLILGVSLFLVRFQHTELIVPMTLAVVGVHFVPLFYIFEYFPHLVLGVCLLVWAFTYPVVLGPTSAMGPLIAGGMLLLGAVWALTRGSTMIRRN